MTHQKLNIKQLVLGLGAWGWGQGVKIYYTFQTLQFLCLLLYPWKFQTKQSFPPGNSENCYTLMDGASHLHFSASVKNQNENSTVFPYPPWKFHFFLIYPEVLRCQLFPQYTSGNPMSSIPNLVWIFSEPNKNVLLYNNQLNNGQRFRFTVSPVCALTLCTQLFLIDIQNICSSKDYQVPNRASRR